MAIIKIKNIQSMQHLNCMFDYIEDLKKTDNGYLVSCFQCNQYTIHYDFEAERKQALKKGNNLAWHIIQSFAPDDDITPEQAHQIGKEFMERKFQGYQYIIATHVDKKHIHNHIILNSVNYITHKKLNTNIKNYYEMREVSDDICRKNNLSVIEKNSKSKTIQLKYAIDETVNNVNDINEFIAEMQKKGYVVKRGRNYFSFKNKEMGRFIRSTSISLDYSEKAIKTRIEARLAGKKIREPKKHRQVQDDKVLYTSKRKILKTEIDNSIEKCNSWEEFKSDMQRKEIIIKDNVKHLAMRLPNGKRNIRTESLGLEYEEDFIKYRLEYKEEFKMLDEIIPKKYNKRGVDSGLAEWMAGENIGIHRKSIAFIQENGIKSWDGTDELFYKFMQKFNAEKEKIEDLENDIKILNSRIRSLVEIKNSIKTFWKLNSVYKEYNKLLSQPELLNSIEKQEYEKQISEYKQAKEILEQAKEELNLDNDIYSLTAIQNVIARTLDEKRELTKEKLECKYKFQNWENIKYNLELTYNVTEERSNQVMQERFEKDQKKQARKDKIREFFHL